MGGKEIIIPAEFESVFQGIKLTEREIGFLIWMAGWDRDTITNLQSVIQKVRAKAIGDVIQPSNEPPPCYQPDGGSCAYQCYDGDDEPIDKCKECPLCYSDKQRHHTPPNEPLTLGLVDKYGAPLYAGDTVAADKFFMYAIRYGSHNVNPKQCEPAYQVGWYLEIVWALYNEDKTYIGHTEALYDIGGVAARYPAHCADTTEGVQNLLLYKHRPPEVSP